MISIIRNIAFVLFLIAPSLSFGQDYLMKGNAAFNSGHYESAIKLFSKYDNVKLDPDILERRGLAYFYINNLPKAIWDFTQAKRLGNNTPDLYLKMAQIKQHLREFDEATFFYQEFINQSVENSPNLQLAKRELKNCIFTAIDDKPKDIALVQSFGEEVNTEFDEIYPIQSPNFGNVFYIASNTNLKDFDIKSFSIDEKGEWSINNEFGEAVNTRKNDIIQDISTTGKTLLFQKNGAENLDKNLVFSTFIEDEEIKVNIPRTVLKDVHDVQIINKNKLAFVSNKLSGFGGYDIYTIEYKNGKWSSPKNAGPSINSMYDDRFPFFLSDLSSLYFSSNRPYCYGGYDIYHYDNDSNEPKAENLGMPINSSGDDINFKLNSDGHMALFSSNRKTGFGGYDVYFAYMKDVNSYVKDSTEFEFITDFIANQENEKLIAEENEKAIKEQQLKEEQDQKDKELAEKKRLEEIAAAKKLKEDLGRKKQKPKETEISTTVLEPTNIELSPTGLVDAQDSTIDIYDQYDISELEAIKSYTIYYEDRNDLLSEINKPKLFALAHKFKNGEKRLRILAYTDFREPGLPEFVQYNTLLRATTISDYLIDLGIDPQSISVESLASNYPIAKKEVAGISNQDYLHLNRRIDFEISDGNGKPLEDHNISPESIPLHSRDRKYILFRDIREELYYSVKIAETERIFKNAVLRLYDDIYIRKETGDGNNDYYIGIYTNFNDALGLQESLKSNSVPINEIVAFYNGRQIESSDIDALTAEYPDLSNYKVSRD